MSYERTNVFDPTPIKQVIMNFYGSKENIRVAVRSDSDVDNRHRVFERAINNESDWFEIFLSNMYVKWNQYSLAKKFNKEVMSGTRDEAKCYKFQVPYKCYNEKLALENGIEKSVAIMSPDGTCFMYYDKDFIHGLEKAKETGYFFVDVPKDRRANTYWFRTINNKTSEVGEAVRENLEWTCLWFYFLTFCVENANKLAKQKQMANNLKKHSKELAKAKAETMKAIKEFQNGIFKNYAEFKANQHGAPEATIKVKHDSFEKPFEMTEEDKLRHKKQMEWLNDELKDFDPSSNNDNGGILWE